ncbi:hypothetical protein F4780DRAFT_150359 [Xylariomycetidae sp. FL0641]|nr:hypothetical protein F4780DRAFT_150359 [Xylariomycetidae sp. FL0641]
MLSQLILTAASAAVVLSTPVQNQRRDGTLPVGTNPIANKFTAEFLGRQKSENSCAGRDLGFTGQLNGDWYAVYGDTLWCAPGVTDPDADPAGFHGMVRDAVARMTGNPLVIQDLHLNADVPVPHPLQFVPFNASWGETNTYGFGGTSIVETAAGAGAVFYLVNTDQNVLRGAGVAKVEVLDGEPTVTARYGDAGYWWPAENTARYGDIAAFRDTRSEYIYAWGGPPSSVTDYPDTQYVYLARVIAADAYDLSKYEYWHGQADQWQSEPLATFTPDTAVMWNTGQGQVLWSDYWNCYIFVHLGPLTTDVLLRTADSPEGPWTPDVTVFTATAIDGGFTYAGVAHPYLDLTGQTLTVSYSNNADVIEVVRISFSK